MTSARVRLVFLAFIAVDLLLLVAPVVAYPPVLRQHGAVAVLLEPFVTLVAYAVLVVAITHRGVPRNATAWGLVSGLISIAHIAQENLVASRSTAALTWLFIIGMFVPWLIAGYQARSLVAGVWSAMICMLLTVMLGWSQLLWDLPHAVARNIGSPDLARSGWTDLHAFAIVDLLQAGFWHLLLGPCIAMVLSGIGLTVNAGTGTTES